MDTETKFVGVSVLCLAYNHEKYIADAIEGFLMQKTSFPFEIIIHDDASTDGTAEIIRQYERNNPRLIKAIYQKENQYSKGININDKFFLPLAQGKYVALCDGDDYWTDPLKLQKQYDALESNPGCYMCVHKVVDEDIVAEEQNRKKRYLPSGDLKTGVLSSKEFFSFIGNGEFFNEVCYFFDTKEYRIYQHYYPEFATLFMKNKCDDTPMLYYFGYKGKAYYINETMAVYRRHTLGSWSDRRLRADKDTNITRFRNAIEAQDAFLDYSNHLYDKEMEYIINYFKFMYAYSTENYKEMLKQEYDCIWAKQSKRFRKRVQMLSRNRIMFGIAFKIYDLVQLMKQK